MSINRRQRLLDWLNMDPEEKRLRYRLSWIKAHYASTEVIWRHRLALGGCTTEHFLKVMAHATHKRDRQVAETTRQLARRLKPRIRHCSASGRFFCSHPHPKALDHQIPQGIGDTSEQAYQDWQAKTSH